MFDNARFSVYADHIADGAGLEISDYLVVAPHTSRKDLITGVAVIALSETEMTFVRVYRPCVETYVLEAARGFVDAGEEPIEAARRELQEETGLAAGQVVSLGTYFPEAGALAARVALFAALDCRHEGGRVDDELGIAGLARIPIPEVEKMLGEMAFEESATCVALHRLFQLRGSGCVNF